MNKNFLYLDTTKFGKVEFVLEMGRSIKKKIFTATPQDSEKILEHLTKFLPLKKIKSGNFKINKIVVYKGGGSFTGLRIAAAVALALGLAWNTTVRFVKKKI